MPTPLTPGAVVAGRYRLERLLGRGGMGEVWAVTHEVTQRTAALKFLRGALSERADHRRRFLREARAASAVNHPNVVHIHDFFELPDGTPVMVMDLLEGETLGERLEREHTLSVADAADVLLPVVSAVGTAHSLGIVHRDLKPDNVFLARTDSGPARVFVLDFGIAKLAGGDEGQDTDGLTGTGALLGTPCYMSPEQSFGEVVDHRSDEWAIGVMLYEALSGVRPIDGENRGRVLQRLLAEAITPIHVLAPDVPEDVATLVGRLLTRDPAGRPADLREVYDVLRHHTRVEAPEFPAAVSERVLAPDSSPLSVRSQPRAVVTVSRDPDPEGATEASSRRDADDGKVTIAAVPSARASSPSLDVGADAPASRSPPPAADGPARVAPAASGPGHPAPPHAPKRAWPSAIWFAAVGVLVARAYAWLGGGAPAASPDAASSAASASVAPPMPSAGTHGAGGATLLVDAPPGSTSSNATPSATLAPAASTSSASGAGHPGQASPGSPAAIPAGAGSAGARPSAPPAPPPGSRPAPVAVPATSVAAARTDGPAVPPPPPASAPPSTPPPPPGLVDEPPF